MDSLRDKFEGGEEMKVGEEGVWEGRCGDEKLGDDARIPLREKLQSPNLAISRRRWGGTVP